MEMSSSSLEVKFEDLRITLEEKKRENQMSSSSSEVKYEDLRIPLKDINSAIAAFSEECIGEGGSAKVYKGKLSDWRGDRIVAIKQLTPESWQGEHEFNNEASMLYEYKHKNIVTFVGYCDDGDQMIIVNEYAVNGSLDKLLCDPDKMRSITWEQRLKICIGAAEGLEYLHYGLGEKYRVIHRDFKSANILLDLNFEAKISDFGLSKFAPRNQPYTRLNTKIVGTAGYRDPNYLETGELTKESDVYSFGVVLFEMLCGRLVAPKENCNPDHDDARSLVHLARLYEDNLEKIIDPHIKDQINKESLNIFQKIAFQCVSDYNKRQRPPMDDVVRRLKEALDYQVGISSGLERPRRYDVFLSFSASDVGKTFAAHLLYNLQQKGINTSIARGSSIAAPVIDVIQRSSIAIIIFSKLYGESSWCLNELVEIMNCHGKEIMPVFYDVDPSEVRNQTGKYKKSFDKHMTMSQEHSTIWRGALAEAGRIYGWDLSNIANRNEVQIIQEIVESVSSKLRTINSNYFRQERPRTYDVSFSFRGSDVRTTFLAHLRYALNQNRIDTFYDQNNIDRGSSIAASILEGMERSLISIVIFSKGYAESRFCLNELVAVIDWHEATRKPVIPVFYDVEPSELRKQTGRFAEAFNELMMREENTSPRKALVTSWRKALVQAGNFSGWDLSNSDNRNEAQCIQEIVQVVSNKLHAIKSNALAETQLVSSSTEPSPH